MNDDMTGNEKLKKAFAASGTRDATAGDCPGDEIIWAAARGELPPDRVQEVLDHSLGCAKCEEGFRMAASMLAEIGEELTGQPPAEHSVPAEVHPFPSRRRFVFAIGAIAAAIFVVIALPMLVRRGDAPPALVSLPSLDETVVTTLWRVGADGDAPLAGGEMIRPGDRLYLTLESDEPVHLYMINRDEAGVDSVLFPVAGAQWRNPLQAGARLRIPGDTSWEYDSWEVSSAGGRDSFFVIAARQPIARLESALELIASASPSGTDEHLRGGEDRPGDAERPGGATDAVVGAAALGETLRDLLGSAGDEDLVFREIVLDNPQ